MSLYVLFIFHTCNVLLLSWTLHEASAPQNAHIALAKCSTLFEVAKKKNKKKWLTWHLHSSLLVARRGFKLCLIHILEHCNNIMEIYRSPHSKKPQDQVVSSIFYWIHFFFFQREKCEKFSLIVHQHVWINAKKTKLNSIHALVH